MTLEEAKLLSLKVLKQVMEEKLDFNNVQLAVVSESTQGYKILNKEELKPVIEEVERVEKEKEEERLRGTTGGGAAASTSTTTETSA
jgi:20S proteasome subunit alpha 5